MFYDIPYLINTILSYEKKRLEKSKNSDFSKGVSPWILSKIGHFNIIFLLGNIVRKKVCYDILD